MAVDWAAEMWTGNFGGKKNKFGGKTSLEEKLIWRNYFKKINAQTPHYQAKVQLANQQISNIYVLNNTKPNYV